MTVDEAVAAIALRGEATFIIDKMVDEVRTLKTDWTEHRVAFAPDYGSGEGQRLRYEGACQVLGRVIKEVVGAEVDINDFVERW